MRANKTRDLMRDSCCEDEFMWLELIELERLAEIGKATEKVLKEGVILADFVFVNGNIEYYNPTIDSTLELLEWFQEESNEK